MQVFFARLLTFLFISLPPVTLSSFRASATYTYTLHYTMLCFCHAGFSCCCCHAFFCQSSSLLPSCCCCLPPPHSLSGHCLSFWRRMSKHSQLHVMPASIFPPLQAMPARKAGSSGPETPSSPKQRRREESVLLVSHTHKWCMKGRV